MGTMVVMIIWMEPMAVAPINLNIIFILTNENGRRITREKKHSGITEFFKNNVQLDFPTQKKRVCLFIQF